jgi:hypothetical protein
VQARVVLCSEELPKLEKDEYGVLHLKVMEVDATGSGCPMLRPETATEAQSACQSGDQDHSQDDESKSGGDDNPLPIERQLLDRGVAPLIDRK